MDVVAENARTINAGSLGNIKFWTLPQAEISTPSLRFSSFLPVMAIFLKMNLCDILMDTLRWDGADCVQREPRSRSRSPDRRYRDRTRSPSRDRDYRSSRRERSPVNGYHDSDRSRAPARTQEDRQQNREQMMSDIREASQQDHCVYVGNLSYDVKWGHLKDFMRKGKFHYPSISLMTIITNTNYSRRCPLCRRTTTSERDEQGKQSWLDSVLF